MAIKKLNTCCGFATLKTGTKIIGWYEIILNVLLFVLLLVVLSFNIDDIYYTDVKDGLSHAGNETVNKSKTSGNYNSYTTDGVTYTKEILSSGPSVSSVDDRLGIGSTGSPDGFNHRFKRYTHPSYASYRQKKNETSRSTRVSQNKTKNIVSWNKTKNIISRNKTNYIVSRNKTKNIVSWNKTNDVVSTGTNGFYQQQNNRSTQWSSYLKSNGTLKNKQGGSGKYIKKKNNTTSRGHVNPYSGIKSENKTRKIEKKKTNRHHTSSEELLKRESERRKQKEKQKEKQREEWKKIRRCANPWHWAWCNANRHSKQDPEPIEISFHQAVQAALVLSALKAIFGICLLVGVHKERECLIKAWLFSKIIFEVLGLLLVLVTAIIIVIILAIPTVGLSLFFMWVVYSFMVQMKWT